MMPCSPRMIGCRVDCAHKANVSAYRAARAAAEIARDEACKGYATEEAAYGPIVTFKRWLMGVAR